MFGVSKWHGPPWVILKLISKKHVGDLKETNGNIDRSFQQAITSVYSTQHILAKTGTKLPS